MNTLASIVGWSALICILLAIGYYAPPRSHGLLTLPDDCRLMRDGDVVILTITREAGKNNATCKRGSK